MGGAADHDGAERLIEEYSEQEREGKEKEEKPTRSLSEGPSKTKDGGQVHNSMRDQHAFKMHEGRQNCSRR